MFQDAKLLKSTKVWLSLHEWHQQDTVNTIAGGWLKNSIIWNGLFFSSFPYCFEKRFPGHHTDRQVSYFRGPAVWSLWIGFPNLTNYVTICCCLPSSFVLMGHRFLSLNLLLGYCICQVFETLTRLLIWFWESNMVKNRSLGMKVNEIKTGIVPLNIAFVCRL